MGNPNEQAFDILTKTDEFRVNGYDIALGRRIAEATLQVLELNEEQDEREAPEMPELELD